MLVPCEKGRETTKALREKAIRNIPDIEEDRKRNTPRERKRGM